MQETELHPKILFLMQELEAEMRLQQLWSAMPPSAEALSSVMPFMYDTLKAHEWLQWIFIPRTRALIDARGRLPGNCHIHALAEHEFAARTDVDSRRLLMLVLEIDNLMNLPRA
jgi:uncharacterized protein YqcC (DUF446 family)